MDLEEMMDGCGGSWTEERHSAFLNWVEESFVRRVLAARGNDPSPHLDLDVKLGASVWLPPPLPLDRFLPDSATESNRNPGRPARPARTRRSATTAVEAEEPEQEEEEEGESVVTSRHRKRKPQPLLSKHKCLKDQLGSAKPDDGITSHKMKAGEAGASQIAQRDANTTPSKKRSASNRSVGAV
ncbi:unnamed protein product [Musa acuminata subsp. malaccensis]|uniref:(wild Malaysian banana) hypothetical protein n=1 Tax=Musa acuminata subsp. malaccensis TaxID=214687 RepID=A0A804J7B6_MUSAM|nr:PREDICTED: uncharacterized protein LOC103985709 isoform X1 [Musa acuminata subsp. malaccensis]CAG1839257.1 unnamed protein product [Musa acuminata subsp. malaccensis]